MPDGRTKMATNLDTRASSVRPLRGLRPDGLRDEGLREVESLRATNAILMRELAEMKEREAETQRLAERDGLTGLYNRRRMLELLEAAISDALLEGQYVGLLFIDLNGFKAINDVYGHAAGDKILTTVASRISARVRTGDIVCRYGGDEFVVVLPNAPDPLAVSRVADAIRERVSLPYWIKGEAQFITAAIGESLHPHDGGNAEALLQRADSAMYSLKVRLGRPVVSLGSLPQQRLSRRRGDKSKPRSSGAQ